MRKTGVLLLAANIFVASTISISPLGAQAANETVQVSSYEMTKAEVYALFINRNPSNDIRDGLNYVPVNDAIEAVSLLEDTTQQTELRAILDKAITQLTAKIKTSLTIETTLNGATEITGELVSQTAFIAEVYNAAGEKIAMTTGMATGNNTYRVALNHVNRYNEDGTWRDMGAVTLEKGMKVKVYVNLLRSNGQRFVATTLTQDVIGIPYEEAVAAVSALFLNDDPKEMVALTTSKASVEEAQRKVNILTPAPEKEVLQGYVDKAETLVGARDAFEKITLSADHKAATFALNNAEQSYYTYQITVNGKSVQTTSSVDGAIKKCCNVE